MKLITVIAQTKYVLEFYSAVLFLCGAGTCVRSCAEEEILNRQKPKSYASFMQKNSTNAKREENVFNMLNDKKKTPSPAPQSQNLISNSSHVLPAVTASGL